MSDNCKHGVLAQDCSICRGLEPIPPDALRTSTDRGTFIVLSHDVPGDRATILCLNRMMPIVDVASAIVESSAPWMGEAERHRSVLSEFCELAMDAGKLRRAVRPKTVREQTAALGPAKCPQCRIRLSYAHGSLLCQQCDYYVCDRCGGCVCDAPGTNYRLEYYHQRPALRVRLEFRLAFVKVVRYCSEQASQT